MPRKKITVPVMAPDGPAVTRQSRARRILNDLRTETGDPWEDGELWLSRIMQARRERAERRNGEKDWRRYYRWYEGEQWNDRGGQGGQIASDNARDTATVNKTGSIITSIRPFLINDEIKFLLKAQRPVEDDYLGVKIQQSLLNYEWRERNMTRPMKDCALDLLVIGHCVAKAGYTVEVDESKKPSADGTINYADYVKKDAPFVECVNPLNFLFDTRGKDRTLHTARWCAEYFFVPFVDVLSNSSYDNETLGMMRSGDATPTTQSAWESQMDGGRQRKERPMYALPEDNLVALIEVWDWKYKKRFIMADGCARPLFVEEWPFLYLDKFPYAMANYIEVPKQPYGLGVPRWVEDQAMQLNRAATLEQDIMRKSRPQRWADPDIGPEEIGKFQAGDDLISARRDQLGVVQSADLSQMFQVYRQNIERVIEETTGADALLQGSRLPSRTTAGEVGTRARLTGLKLDQHVEDFEEFVEDIAGQVLAHLKKHRTVADIIEITGEDGVPYWQEYTNEQLQDDARVDVEYFSAPKTDPALEIQQRKDILSLIVSAMPVMAERTDQIPDIPKVVEWVLDAYGEKDTTRFFRPLRTAGAPTGEAGPGQGLPPELAGQLAPAPMGETPGVSDPTEGLEVSDLMQQLRGFTQ